MEENQFAEAIRTQILNKLGNIAIESEEVDALIDEIGHVVFSVNKILINEIRQVQKQMNFRLDGLSYGMDALSEELDELQEKTENVSNISNVVNINVKDEANIRIGR
ncbi:hypothetical protein ACPA0F_18305 [Solibacillus silvestris]